MKDHWENVYATREVCRLGWHQETPGPSAELLARCGLAADNAILDVGAGASVFVDHLLANGFTNIIATDISEIALDKLKERLGAVNAGRVRWIVDDITSPVHLRNLNDIALWHDRALLHFLLEEVQQKAYLSTLKSVVKKGGFVIIGVFSLEGAKKCSGLDLKNYDEKMLADFLGNDFTLLEHLSHTHITPSGDPRPYVYTWFQRK